MRHHTFRQHRPARQSPSRKEAAAPEQTSPLLQHQRCHERSGRQNRHQQRPQAQQQGRPSSEQPGKEKEKPKLKLNKLKTKN